VYTRILVPLDGSDTAERGLDEAIALASELKATLYLLNLSSDFAEMAEMAGNIDFEPYRAGLNQYGKDLLEKASVRAVGRGIKTEILLRELRGGSRVAEAIVKAARDARCELIVIGTHGRRGVRRALLGSDAEDVVRTSHVPVLVVREAATVS